MQIWSREFLRAVVRASPSLTQLGDNLNVGRVVTHKLVCENAPFKLTFMKNHGMLDDGALLVKDCADLGGSHAPDHNSDGAMTLVPWCAIFICGFACTSVSRLNINSHTFSAFKFNPERKYMAQKYRQ